MKSQLLTIKIFFWLTQNNNSKTLAFNYMQDITSIGTSNYRWCKMQTYPDRPDFVIKNPLSSLGFCSLPSVQPLSGDAVRQQLTNVVHFDQKISMQR